MDMSPQALLIATTTRALLLLSPDDAIMNFWFYEVATTSTRLASETALGSPALQHTVAFAFKLSCLCCGYTIL